MKGLKATECRHRNDSEVGKNTKKRNPRSKYFWCCCCGKAKKRGHWCCVCPGESSVLEGRGRKETSREQDWCSVSHLQVHLFQSGERWGRGGRGCEEEGSGMPVARLRF